MLDIPIIIINFKTYKEATGDNALKLAKACENAAAKEGVSIAAAVQACDICRVAEGVSIPVLAQHVDSISFGRNTGFILPECVKDAGAKGTLLNHSEHKLEHGVLESSVKVAKECGLAVVACATDSEDAKRISAMGPDFIAVEPPELIGGEVSVSDARPEIISDSVRAVKEINPNIRVLCGAGIKNREDVKKAVELGAEGVLVASGVVVCEDHEKAVVELARGLKRQE